jgi:hypothetical protein
MTHPYSQSELEAMSPQTHVCPCNVCKYVDDENPTAVELEARMFCGHCLGSGEISAAWGCGDNTVSAFRKKADDLPSVNGLVLCLNCHIQRHHEACGGCDNGWAEGS